MIWTSKSIKLFVLRESDGDSDFLLAVYIVAISLFLELGRTIDLIASLSPVEAIKTETTYEDVLDGIFRNLFKKRPFHVCQFILHCVLPIPLLSVARPP